MNTHTKATMFCSRQEIMWCILHYIFRFLRIVALRVAEYNRRTPIHTRTVSLSDNVNAFLVSSIKNMIIVITETCYCGWPAAVDMGLQTQLTARAAAVVRGKTRCA
jgi:hypothetical protein